MGLSNIPNIMPIRFFFIPSDEVVHRIGVEMEQTSLDIEHLAYVRANNRQDYMYMIYRSIISNMELGKVDVFKTSRAVLLT